MKPRVQLIDISADAFNHMVAAARTCYSGNGPVQASDVAEQGPSRDRIARSVYQAGHHTTLQHAQLRFSLEGVSRHFLWSFLHSHPFYNSEQVSQRYVPVKEGNTYRPELKGEAGLIYDQVCKEQVGDYRRLSEMLLEPCLQHYLNRFPARRNQPRSEREALRRAQEIARYLLPLATTAYLHHSISVLTLMRYYRLCRQWDVPEETGFVVSSMVEALLAKEPDFANLLEEPLPLEETPEYLFFQNQGIRDEDIRDFRKSFDASLQGYRSLLLSADPSGETLLADSVREVLGLPPERLSEEEALGLALDPSRNSLWSETLNLSTLNRLARPLYHLRYVFRRKLSHSADSQDQRHRMTPASRPPLLLQENGEPDYETPPLLEEVPEAVNLYRNCMERSWEGIARFRKAGGSREDALYLLPNAKRVRYTESADLLNYRHKSAMRLCFNAQEEIWRLNVEEVEQIGKLQPRVAAALLPPCGHRHQAARRPVCPEGDRYCGVQVWKQSLSDWKRSI
ncbi:MAG: FAD-dependent thymidylate synthase [Candidatus Krumholzibacteria bacterium]|jgi:thymidylate synthase ThyX|nr:FAD-dependent thymidylate synthase [Candidatus Krumholzibacteria bacterium]MDP6797055.1 FAD-dependent thymidylate synthase [Candidatus Krumholzibacteria bacterium]MDP7022092.1 FAD-dependent thymidylate synthase [Candidatus Krumholzibacteria bacterium]